MEVTFERRDIAKAASPPKLWVNCVPDYWIGKKVWVEYHDQDVYSLMQKGGTFSSTSHEYVGTFHSADADTLKIAIDPLEHGKLPRCAGFKWGQVTAMKLMEDELDLK